MANKSAYRKGFHDAKKQAETIVHEILKVWLAYYVPEECTDEHRRWSQFIRRQCGGTLGYMADVEQAVSAMRPKSNE